MIEFVVLFAGKKKFKFQLEIKKNEEKEQKIISSLYPTVKS